MVRKIIFQYVGMPEKSEFSEEPLIPSSGKEVEKKVAFDEYNISILAPQEAAERFQKWLQHAVIRNNDYREMLIPMFKPTTDRCIIYLTFSDSFRDATRWVWQ